LVKKTSNSVQNQVVFHEVLQKETKYSIAKKYDISIDELEKKNPEMYLIYQLVSN
jgi:DNA-directed RNA polymerase subunit H (RpoH/RPB5)